VSFVERALAVRRWRKDGKRAPHKPLLLLYALARFQREGDAPIVYSVVEGELAALVREFGPPNPTGLYYPFHHLTGDGLWTVTTRDGGPSPGPSPSKLRDSGAWGRFTPEVVDELRRRPEVVVQAAHALLDDNFPESLHEGICEAVGLDLHETGLVAAGTVRARRRDPGFRRAVLRAYEYMCAFCGYEGRLDDGSSVGLDAAHIRWFALDGPDTVDNGLCLCSLHHVLFDKGVLTLTDDHRVDVTGAFMGRTPNTRAQVHALAGRRVEQPRQGIGPAHLLWHRAEVFRGAGTAA